MAKPGATERSEDEQEFCRETGRRIKAIREGKRMSQSELARRLQLDQGTLSLYESGTTDMPCSRIHRIAAALDTSPALLMGGEQADEWMTEVERSLGQLKIVHVKKLVRLVLEEAKSEQQDELSAAAPMKPVAIHRKAA